MKKGVPKKDVYSFLKETVRILVVEHSHEQIAVLQEALAPLELYAITGTTSVLKADRLLAGGQCFHMCISELNIGDTHLNEYELLRRYGGRVPFLIASSAKSLESGFIAKSMGAKAIVCKQEVTLLNMLQLINRIFLDVLVTPSDGQCNDALLSRICTILTSRVPASVEEWAEFSHIDVSYLRKKWREWFFIKPKHAIFLYNLYVNATSYSEKKLRGHGVEKPINAEERKRIKRYFTRNREMLNRMLYKQL